MKDIIKVDPDTRRDNLKDMDLEKYKIAYRLHRTLNFRGNSIRYIYRKQSDSARSRDFRPSVDRGHVQLDNSSSLDLNHDVSNATKIWPHKLDDKLNGSNSRFLKQRL